MADSSAIDNALVTKLGSDSALLTLCPNGAYMDEAPAGMTSFVIVSLADQADAQKFGGRAFEDALYQVEARIRSDVATANAIARAAEVRIEALLEDQPLTVSGYAWMTTHRESRIRLVEVDDADTSIRWYRRGGNYRLLMSPV